MKHSTAKTIIAKMFDGKIVKLRKSKIGGISNSTFCALADTLFYMGYEEVEYKVMYFQDGTNQVVMHSNDTVISSKIILF